MSKKKKDGAGEQPPKGKREFFDSAMLGDHVLLHLDSRRPGVEVPPHLERNHSLTLKLSYRFQGTTERDENGITAYLRFSGTYHKCIIPWAAIWGMTTVEGDRTIWPEDVPRELLVELTKLKITELGKKFFGKKDKDDEAQPADHSPDHPPLELVQPLKEVAPKKGEPGETEESDIKSESVPEETPPKSPGGKRVPFLRRVK